MVSTQLESRELGHAWSKLSPKRFNQIIVQTQSKCSESHKVYQYFSRWFFFSRFTIVTVRIAENWTKMCNKIVIIAICGEKKSQHEIAIALFDEKNHSVAGMAL